MEDGYEAEMTAFLEDYMESSDPGMSYLSAQAARESSEATQRMIRLVGGFVGLIFGLAGILESDESHSSQRFSPAAASLPTWRVWV